ncbi:hypothetical protein MTO96_051762 [Rhipicephalus appendiculatus]
MRTTQRLTTSTLATTASTKPPNRTRPLVCQVMSPEYVDEIAMKIRIDNSIFPLPGLCDYIMVDIPQEDDGKYKPSAYAFLQRHGVFNKARMTETGRDIRQTVRLHGFGFLNKWSRLNPTSYIPSELRYNGRILKLIFARFTEVMTGLGVPRREVANFYNLRMPYLSSKQRAFVGILEGLNIIPREELRFVFLLTITSQSVRPVLPSSAWDRRCLPPTNDTTIEEAVNLIAKLKPRVFTFALTLTLRWDLFKDTALANLGTDKLNKVISSEHKALRFEEECLSAFVGGQYIGSRITIPPDGGCEFGQVGTTDVASFETQSTIEYKMTMAYLRLKQLMPGAEKSVGWLAFNVTGGLAPEACDGTQHRLKKMREVIDRV